ncbi:MAG: prepilin-type N-terminal cleavage/methylation domain-containing protein [Acidobacteriota bacterium]|nr:prepilin-type N-terminal cleavage/methylation domain-containing protein [Acidobacteriota bacterium]
MKKRNSVSQRGYSLIEIMIVLVITAILVTFAIARFGNAGTNFKRQNISRELKVNLERARFDSVKRRAENTARAEVTLVNATSFTVKTDMNQNGTLDASDTKTIDFTGQSNVKIVGDALVFPITIQFDRYGRIEAKDKTEKDITPIFTICTDGCAADNATPANADVIYVSPSGTVAMLKGGEKQPTFASPENITVVEVDKQINNELRVKSANSLH